MNTVLSTNFAMSGLRLAATSSGVNVGLADAPFDGLMIGFWVKGSPDLPGSGQNFGVGGFCIEVRTESLGFVTGLDLRRVRTR
jgi:hypothetical protein